ncbi:MAG: hypothetical protein ABGW90_15615, partial [Martelella sp.]
IYGFGPGTGHQLTLATLPALASGTWTLPKTNIPVAQNRKTFLNERLIPTANQEKAKKEPRMGGSEVRG